MRRIAAVLIGALCFVRGAAAQAPPAQSAPPRPATPKSSPPPAVPDLAFLEYLGSWQGDDDEWLAIKEWDQDAAPKGKPPDAKAKAPPVEPKEPAPQQAGSDHDKAQ